MSDNDDLTFNVKEAGLSEITRLYKEMWHKTLEDLNSRLEGAYEYMAMRSKFCIEFYNKMTDIRNKLDDGNHKALVKDIDKFLKEKKYW